MEAHGDSKSHFEEALVVLISTTFVLVTAIAAEKSFGNHYIMAVIGNYFDHFT